jgi:hypothetical protein
MHTSLLIRYFFSGVFFTNSVPHVAIGLTGRRNMTPFGRDSSAVINGLWGLVNILGGYLLLRTTDPKLGGQEESHAWLLAFLSGGLFWSLVMVVVELSGFTHRTPHC